MPLETLTTQWHERILVKAMQAFSLKLARNRRLWWRLRASIIHGLRRHEERKPEPTDEAEKHFHWDGIMELDEWATKLTAAHYMAVAHRLHVPLPPYGKEVWGFDRDSEHNRHLNDAGIDDLRKRARVEVRDRYKVFYAVVGSSVVTALLLWLGKMLLHWFLRFVWSPLFTFGWGVGSDS